MLLVVLMQQQLLEYSEHYCGARSEAHPLLPNIMGTLCVVTPEPPPPPKQMMCGNLTIPPLTYALLNIIPQDMNE